MIQPPSAVNSASSESSSSPLSSASSTPPTSTAEDLRQRASTLATAQLSRINGRPTSLESQYVDQMSGILRKVVDGEPQKILSFLEEIPLDFFRQVSESRIFFVPPTDERRRSFIHVGTIPFVDLLVTWTEIRSIKSIVDLLKEPWKNLSAILVALGKELPAEEEKVTRSLFCFLICFLELCPVDRILPCISALDPLKNLALESLKPYQAVLNERTNQRLSNWYAKEIVDRFFATLLTSKETLEEVSQEVLYGYLWFTEPDLLLRELGSRFSLETTTPLLKRGVLILMFQILLYTTSYKKSDPRWLNFLAFAKAKTDDKPLKKLGKRFVELLERNDLPKLKEKGFLSDCKSYPSPSKDSEPQVKFNSPFSFERLLADAKRRSLDKELIYMLAWELKNIIAHRIVRISLSDLACQRWKKAPPVCFVVNFIDYMYDLVLAKILDSNLQDSERVNVCQLFVDVAYISYFELGDLHSTYAFKSALDAPELDLEKPPLSQMDEKHRQKLRAIIEGMGSRIKMEAATHRGTIPFFGSITSKLTFAHDGNPYLLQGKLNWKALEMFSKVTRDFVLCQRMLQPINIVFSDLHQAIQPQKEGLMDTLKEQWQLYKKQHTRKLN